MDFHEWNRKIDEIKANFTSRAISRIDTEYALRQLGQTPVRIAQLLREWEDEHSLSHYTLTKS